MTKTQLLFALFIGFCMAALPLSQGAAFAQDMPPVFQDTTDNPRPDRDQFGKGWPKRPDPPPAPAEETQPPQQTQTQTQQQPAEAEVPDDPCAAYMDNYNAYTFCTDRYKKIERMRSGTEKRRATYSPPPPKEEAKPAEGEGEKPAGEKAEGEKKEGEAADKKDGDKKEGDAKKDDKSSGDKDKKEDEKKSESTDKDAKK